ncbi:MAG: hypothetical protein U0Q15_09825 [Kineosporiaceae bacterium]
MDRRRNAARVGFHVAVVVVAAAVLEAVSGFGVPVIRMLVLLAIGLALALGWAAWLARSVSAGRSPGRTGERPPGLTRRLPRDLLVAPLTAALVVGLVAVDAPLRLRWAVSRSAFAREVADVTADVPRAGHGWIGLYRMDGAQRVADGVLFTGSCDLETSPCGVALLTGPPPEVGTPAADSRTFQPLDGGWYRWAVATG